MGFTQRVFKRSEERISNESGWKELENSNVRYAVGAVLLTGLLNAGAQQFQAGKKAEVTGATTVIDLPTTQRSSVRKTFGCAEQTWISPPWCRA